MKAWPDRGRAGTARRDPRTVPLRAMGLAFGLGTAYRAVSHAGLAQKARHG